MEIFLRRKKANYGINNLIVSIITPQLHVYNGQLHVYNGQLHVYNISTSVGYSYKKCGIGAGFDHTHWPDHFESACYDPGFTLMPGQARSLPVTTLFLRASY